VLEALGVPGTAWFWPWPHIPAQPPTEHLYPIQLITSMS
jgi:hypothetical protein